MQSTEAFGGIKRATIRFAVDGHESLWVAVVGRNRVGDPVLKAALKGFRFQSQQEPTNAVTRGDAVGQGEMLTQPVRLKRSPAMNGRRTITPAEDAADRDHGDIDEEMFAIACVPGVGQGFEVTADGTDINELHHERHPCDSATDLCVSEVTRSKSMAMTHRYGKGHHRASPSNYPAMRAGRGPRRG